MMEEAYAALYQEFVRLQSLCLKQAAIIQHLSDTIQRQQGLATAPTRNFEKPCQCTEERSAHQLLPAECYEHKALGHPTGPHILDPQPGNDLGHIDRGLDKLRLNLDVPDQKQADHDKAVFHYPVKTAENSAWDDLRRVEQHYYANQTSQRLRRPWSSSFLDSELVSQAGGLFMSEVMLQSQVCEFCHAVFPGHTSTRGEFLRHLTTHMT
uniref:Zgc:113184 n=1 Tax=Cyprinus carpio TaxID=7962 RepID=A0A8C2E0U3_CYPCA